MADETETTEVETPPVETERKPPPEDNLLGEEKRLRQKAQRELRELQERLEELEAKDQSELERERKAREKAEQENQTLASKVDQLEKGAWVRDAASEAKFHNPSAATSHLDLSQIETADDAARAVKDLAKREKWMVNDAPPEKPQVGQVLRDGQAVQQQPRTPQEAAALNEQAIRDRDADAVKQALTEIGVFQPQQ